MKQFKKATLALLAMCVLALCTVFCAANASAANVRASGSCGTNVSWVLYDDGALVVSGEGAMTNWEYGADVSWFSHRFSIKTATIQEGVTSIGGNAFYGSSLTSVTIPDSVTYIGNGAFYMCSNLTTVNMGKGVTNIGYSAFYTTGVLPELTLPETLEYAGNSAFISCETVTVLSRDASFGAKVFGEDATVYGYTGSTADTYTAKNNITFVPLTDEPVEEIPTSGSCGDNLSWMLTEEGELIIEGKGDSLIWDPYEMAPWYPLRDSILSVSMPDGLTSIGDFAFAQCGSITEITVPANVTYIGDCAFAYCDALTSVTVLADNANIDDGAFSHLSTDAIILYGNSDSAIEAYATEKGFKFALISDSSEKEITASGECGDNLSWVLYDNGELIISGKGDMVNRNNGKETPWFSYNKEITSVVIEAGVTSIGNYSFDQCENLKRVTIPDGVTRIGIGAFQLCSSLTEITIPETVSKIEPWAFNLCTALTTIDIPSGVVSIGSYGFYQCKGLTKVTISDSVEIIDSMAFCACESLTSFEVAENNPFFCSDEDGILFDKEKTILIQYPIGREADSYIIPESVTKIGASAFERCRRITKITLPSKLLVINEFAFCDCTSLTNVTLPDSLRTIGQGAFQGCEAFTTVVIPKGVNLMGEAVFSDCSSITAFEVAKHNTRYSVDSSGVLFDFNKTVLLQYPLNSGADSYTIPSTVLEIANGAFRCCPTLVHVTIPQSVCIIDNNAFASCSKLTDVVLPESVTTIGSWAFSTCSALTEITIPASVTNLGQRAFMSCSNLANAAVFSPDMSYGRDVFIKTSSDFTLHGFEGSATQTYAEKFGHKFSALTESDLPEKTVVDSGKCGPNATWTLYSNCELVIEGTGAITKSYFSGRNDFSTLTIADTITSIEGEAFYSCRNLQSVTIGSDVATIYSRAFGKCPKLTDITVSENNPNFSSNEDGVLFNREKTVLLQYPAGREASTYSVPKSVTEISAYAFGDCVNLTSVILPDSVTAVGSSAFEFCSKLRTISLGNSVKAIDKAAFYSCSSLENILLPETLLSIGNQAFSNCFILKKIVIPASVSHIGDQTFTYCKQLRTVTVLSEKATFGSNVLSYTPANLTLYGYKGSTAETYAAENAHNFSILDGSSEPEAPERVVVSTGDCGETLTWTLYKDGELVINGEGAMYNWNWNGSPWVSYRTTVHTVTLPKGITSIGNHAFQSFTNLRNCVIPEGVTHIGKYAFTVCNELRSITIPASVSFIDFGAFERAVKLTGITVDKNNIAYCNDEHGVLFTKDMSILIQYPCGRTDTSYTIPDGVAVISGYAFYHASALTEISIPESVVTIEQSAFSNCEALTNLVIPSSVLTIQNGAFTRCSSLAKITVDANNPNYLNDENGVLFNKSKTMLIQYPCGNTNTSYSVPEGIFTICASAFDGSANLTSVILPDSLIRINSLAFQGCENLTEITISENVTNIDFGAFNGCVRLTKVTVLSEDVVFSFNAFNENPDLVFFGYEGSSAEEFALSKNISFTAIERPNQEPEQSYTPGDISGDGKLDISDAMRLFQYSLMPTLYPVDYDGNMDFNKDGSIDIKDVLKLFQHSLLPSLYPLDEEGVYANRLKKLINALDFTGIGTFFSASELNTSNIIELSHSFAEDYGVDFTPYREYESDWLYIDHIPADVFHTLTQRMWGKVLDLETYDQNNEYFGFDPETQILRFSNVGGRSFTPVHFFDSYTIENDQITAMVKYYTIVYEKPTVGAEGEDWYTEQIWGEDAYFVFTGWKQLKATIVDGYIRLDAYLPAN